MSIFKELKRRNVIRVGIAYVLVSWLVLQVIDFLLELTDAPSWVLQVFFITAAVGLPVVLVFSWVYEMTPEGLKLEKDVKRDTSITPTTGRKLNTLILAAMGFVIVLLVAGQFLPSSDRAESVQLTDQEAQLADTPPPEPEESIPSIAVLPFVNMSSDPEQEYFSDGISEEILNSLARVDGLKVAGRTSSFAFKGRNEDLREIGEALGVEHILEGSVRKQGNQVRITAQLIQAEDGFHLWSDTYDRTLDDIFAIQDEIANAILQETRIQLLDGEAISVTRADPIAYQNYVAAKQRIHERTKGGLTVARRLLEDAVEIDPEFAGAWAQLGVTIMLLSDGFGSYGDIPEAESLVLGREYLDKALELDPESPEALAGMGLWYQNAPPLTLPHALKSIEVLERSYALDPAPMDTVHWLQRAYQFSGVDVAKAQELMEKMVDRDPLFWPGVSNLVFLYARQGRLEEAMELSERTMRYRPLMPMRQKALIFSFEGRYAEAKTDIMEIWEERKDPLIYSTTATALWGLNQVEEAVELEGAPDGYPRAMGLAILNRNEEAMIVANKDYEITGSPGSILTVLTIQGKYSDAVNFLEGTWPDLEDFHENFSTSYGFGNPMMLDVALAYRETGNDQKFRQAMEYTRAIHDQDHDAEFDNIYLDAAEAFYWSLAGNQDQALDWLEKAINKGWVASPRLSKAYPHLRTLEGLPRYEELQIQALVHMNEQRALLELPPVEAAY